MVHSVVAKNGRVWASHDHLLYKFDSSLTKEAEANYDLSGLAVSDDGAHVAGITADSKQVIVLDSGIKNIEATHEFPKRPSGISISGKDIIVGDKFGDVFHRQFLESSQTHKDDEPILGHVSMVLDVTFASPEFVITSDRDEHIRISRFPKSYVIEKFLLGHESFVSHLVLSGQYLFSGGGDLYVLAWDWKTGKQLAKLDVSDNVVAMAATEDKLYIGTENSHTVLEVRIPSLTDINKINVGGPVQSLSCANGKCYVGLPSVLREVTGTARFEFDTKDSELVSESHLKKRSDSGN